MKRQSGSTSLGSLSWQTACLFCELQIALACLVTLTSTLALAILAYASLNIDVAILLVLVFSCVWICALVDVTAHLWAGIEASWYRAVCRTCLASGRFGSNRWMISFIAASLCWRFSWLLEARWVLSQPTVEDIAWGAFIEIIRFPILLTPPACILGGKHICQAIVGLFKSTRDRPLFLISAALMVYLFKILMDIPLYLLHRHVELESPPHVVNLFFLLTYMSCALAPQVM